MAYAPPGRPGLVARLRRSAADYRAYRRTVAELSRLSRGELADLGISRSDIAMIASETVYGR